MDIRRNGILNVIPVLASAYKSYALVLMFFKLQQTITPGQAPGVVDFHVFRKEIDVFLHIFQPPQQCLHGLWEHPCC